MQTSTGKRYAALLANPGRKISRHETFSISMRMDGSYRRGGTFERAFCSIHRGDTAQTRSRRMKRTWTIIGVRNVASSCAWYQSLLGLPPKAPAHDYFGQIVDGDGTVLLCLHAWGEHDHPSLTSPDVAGTGNGLLIFIRVDNFDEVLKRARGVAGGLVGEPYVNPNTGTMELSLRDPDGYYVSISAADKD